jgi:hypothetical protein
LHRMRMQVLLIEESREKRVVRGGLLRCRQSG